VRIDSRDDARDLELGALLKDAASARAGLGRARPGRASSPASSRRIGARRLALPIAAAASLAVAIGGGLWGPSILARQAALRDSMAFARDLLHERSPALSFELPPALGEDSTALEGFIDDLWAAP
jgi:hypothetical protein